jgi:hypothetical protein
MMYAHLVLSQTQVMLHSWRSCNNICWRIYVGSIDHIKMLLYRKKGGCVNVTYLPGQNKCGDLTVQISLCSALGSLCVSSCSLALCKTSSISTKPLTGWWAFVLTTEGRKWVQSVQKYCYLIFSRACQDSEAQKCNKLNSNVMEQSAGSTSTVGLWGCQEPHPRLQPMWTSIIVGPIRKVGQPRALYMSNQPFFSLFPHKAVGTPESQLDRKNKTKSVSQNHLKH